MDLLARDRRKQEKEVLMRVSGRGLILTRIQMEI